MASRKKPWAWPPTQNLTKFSEAALSWSLVRRCVWRRAWGWVVRKVLAAPDITILSLRVTHVAPAFDTLNTLPCWPITAQRPLVETGVETAKYLRASAPGDRWRGRDFNNRASSAGETRQVIRVFVCGKAPPCDCVCLSVRSTGSTRIPLRVGLSAVMSKSGTLVCLNTWPNKGLFRHARRAAWSAPFAKWPSCNIYARSLKCTG